MQKYVLEAVNIRKAFPGTLALNDVSCSFTSGSVHAVIGKNGSGKSTLMKIFSGAYQKDSGDIVLYGDKIEHNSTTQSLENGIATVYQELSLVSDLTVGENIFLGRLPMKNRFAIDWTEVETQSQKVLAELGMDLDPRTKVSELPVGTQQLVEIAKAMSFDPKVLILDEPTSALSNSECDKLFTIIHRLRNKGIIILYITHRLQELYRVADYVTVLRDGKLIGTESMDVLEPEDIVNMMFGEVEHSAKAESYVQDEVVLEVKNLKNHKLDGISFSVRKGEILGIAGMMGSGRTELLRAIYGVDHLHSGSVLLFNEPVKNVTSENMRNLGVGYTSENRKEEALCLDLSIGDNLTMASLREISPKGRIDRAIEEDFVQRQIKAMSIKVSDPQAPAFSMSGGNQQKIVIGNWLNTQPSLLLMDEPSRGIDVNAKQQIFNIMWEEARNGIAIVMVSSELEELLEVCDRILIMKDGQLRNEYMASSLTVEKIYSECMKESIHV